MPMFYGKVSSTDDVVSQFCGNVSSLDDALPQFCIAIKRVYWNRICLPQQDLFFMINGIIF